MPQKTKKCKLRKPSIKLTQILADNMRVFRRKNGLSQEDLADMCSLHRTYIGSVERGERNVTLSTLEVIAGALGVSIIKLLSERGIEDETKQKDGAQLR